MFVAKLADGGGTVVEYLPHHSKVEGSTPAASGTGEENGMGY
jgi:hypothetical protein